MRTKEQINRLNAFGVILGVSLICSIILFCVALNKERAEKENWKLLYQLSEI